MAANLQIRRQDELEAVVHAIVEALRHSEERFRAAFDASPLGMLRVARDGTVVQANRALTKMLGGGPEPATALELLIHPNERARQRQLLDGLFSGVHDHYQVEQRFLLADGSVMWASLSMALVARDDGRRELAIGTVEDLTERKQLENGLRRAQRLESVGLLAAGIAHEINTPVQFIGDNLRFLGGAFADLMSLLSSLRLHHERCTCQPPPPSGGDEVAYLRKEVPRAVEETLDGVERVAAIVRALKSFAHVHRQGESQATDLNQALSNTILVARNEFKYVADVETNFGALPLVRCHPGDLNQAFLHLLVNAAHAVGEAHAVTGKRGLIRVATRVEGERVEIAFADSGPGIPLEIRGKIFDPFFTTRPAGGAGQGLSIVRAVVADKHGGCVRFESEMGRGTTFYIELPIDGRVERSGES